VIASSLAIWAKSLVVAIDSSINTHDAILVAPNPWQVDTNMDG